MTIQSTLIQALELQAAGQAEAAATRFREVLAIDPANAHALYSLGLLALNAGDLAQALNLCDEGVAAQPGFAPLHYLRGAVLLATGRRDEALRSFDTALQLQPDYIEVLLNSGALLRDMFRHREALERFNRILAISPDHTGALANCGILLSEFKQSEAAIRMFERLVTVAPDYDYGLGLLFYEQMHICDWRLFDQLTQQIVQGVRAGKRVCKSLALMSASDQASDHLQAARIFASHHCPPAAAPMWNGEKYRHTKIRLAYVSPDFREHPVGHLMAGIFEHHDHTRFETIAISLGVDDQSRLRARIQASFDQFIDCSSMRPEQIARLMRELEIDIAIDLGGFTSDTKTALFAHRPAPVQVNYLGYPGSMGTPYHDYLIADRHVIPQDRQADYSEKVVYLPDSYLPIDNSIRISPETPSRQACSLPEDAFVFCSFSHDYKISPPVFAVWMDLLVQVPGSVLWLATRSEAARRNLRLQAQARGVDPVRLVFAERLPRIEDHLARYRQADLFLDTHPYNAHTTAADALMAGLPVLTFEGSAFPSRVAASLLRSAGLPDMVMDSLQAYASRALELARDPAALSAIRARLIDNQARQPLFDTAGFCRNLEAVLASIRKEEPMARSLDLGCGPVSKNPAMDRTIHIIYRHIPTHAEKFSRDPHKSRPPWFSYQSCFHNLMSTIRSDPRGHQVRVLILFDGSMEDFLQDFIATYYANASLQLGVQFVKGGSNGASFLIALDMLRKSELPDSDILYFLENDYLHQHGWVSKTLELFESGQPVDIVSLYDHRDKYEFEMYAGLRSRICITPTHHWRTVPSTCGTFLIEKSEMMRDYDIWTANLIDYMLFPKLQDERGRVLLTPVPGLATHCMAGYLSPTVDWQALAMPGDTRSTP